MFYLYKEKIKLDRDKVDLPSLSELIKTLPDSDALSICLYVFLTSDRTENNPLRDMEELDRLAEANKIAVGRYEPSSYHIYTVYPDLVTQINRCQKEYADMNVEKLQKDVDVYDKKLYQFAKTLTDTKPVILKNTHDISGKVSFTTNIDIITTILENVIKIIIDKATMVGLRNSGKYTRSLRGRLSPNTKGKLTTDDAYSNLQ